MNCGHRDSSSRSAPVEFIKMVYVEAKEKHPNKCYGLWTWVAGLLVKCQGCGYKMRINPKNGRLEHLASIEKAVEDCLQVKQYGQSDKP